MALAALLATSAAHAQDLRCDCTSVVASCEANVAVLGNFIEITTDPPQCARVDYFVDGQPFVALVVDGANRQDWVARTGQPRILVQSCQVCRANAGASASAAPRAPAAAAAASDGALEPLIEVTPSYPPAALARSQRGHVDVEFTVTPRGDVEDPRVTGAEPAGVFDQAALAAVRRWRYPRDEARAPQTVTRRVEFNPARAAQAAPVERAAAIAAPAGPRNQCVREEASYNYGEMVEIDLMNTCGEPLLVFGCAEGTGRYLERWVCTDSESQQSVLVSSSDTRVGARTSVATADGTRAFTFGDSFHVSRAPNSEYWWVACALTDAACRDGARQWIRAIDRQSASIDPQDRSAVAVARSY
jgi:TonB family protein